APAQLCDALAAIRAEPLVAGAGYGPGSAFSHRLISRRMRQVFNSTGVQLEALRRRGPGNPAFMNPQGMRAAGIRSGAGVEIASDHGRIEAIARADGALSPGVISMAHSWGGLPDHEDLAADPAAGACTNRLISSDRD